MDWMGKVLISNFLLLLNGLNGKKYWKSGFNGKIVFFFWGDFM